MNSTYTNPLILKSDKAQTYNLDVEYGSFDSLFGICFVAITQEAICHLSFLDTITELEQRESELAKKWTKSSVIKNQAKIASLETVIFTNNESKMPLKLFLRGTAFQLNVWETLLTIPFGQLVAYQTIANNINKPTATRAVASAIAKNTIAYLIPCHRAIRKSGDVGQYRWNKERKKALIEWELAANAKH